MHRLSSGTIRTCVASRSPWAGSKERGVVATASYEARSSGFARRMHP